jgi:hypothetical protein
MTDSIIKERLVDGAHRSDTVQAFVLYLDSNNTSGGEVIMFKDEVRFMFTYEEVQKINSTYRLVEIMNEVIEKYGTEKDFSINIIAGLNEEITLMDDKLKIKDGKLANCDKLNKKLESIIKTHEEKDIKNEELLSNNKDQIKNLKKDNKKLKFISKLTGGSTIVLIVVLVILL